MRTVTFSDPAVVKQLNESFVCAWVNKRPDEKFKDGARRSWSDGSLPNGIGISNLTSIFAAPDGTVLHAMAGSLDVSFFLTQIAFAKDVRHRMYEANELRPHGEASYFAAHRTAHEGVEDRLVSGVHGVLARRIRKVQDMPLTLFDKLEGGRECHELKPVVCGFSVHRLR